MSERKTKYWAPIEDLSENWQSLKNPGIDALVEAWIERADQMRENESYKDFLIKMRRKWAIETGILERLYYLSEGATRTIVEKGFDASFISHEDTDRLPADVIALISDQHYAIEGLYQFISRERPLGRSYIRELHQVLTAHQPSYEAVDTQGKHITTELPRGEWKKLPNNVEGPNGLLIEFCPPEQVDSEMDNMIEIHTQHLESNIPPYIEAAWLLHRFTLIHPFVDGNGRVARCLATLVLLQAGWFPLVITRQERGEYIAALQAADEGDLGLLVSLIVRLQNMAIREAFSLSEELIEEERVMREILTAVKNKYRRAREELETKKMHVLTTGDTLLAFTEQKLKEVGVDISEAIREEGPDFRAYTDHATRNDEKRHYQYFQTIQCARKLGYFANIQVFQAWAILNIITDIRTELLFAFHGMGKGSSGVLVCTSMVYSREKTTEGDSVISEITPLCDEPFSFTYTENPTDVSRRFGEWIDNRVLDGLDYWRKAVGA